MLGEAASKVAAPEIVGIHSRHIGRQAVRPGVRVQIHVTCMQAGRSFLASGRADLSRVKAAIPQN